MNIHMTNFDDILVKQKEYLDMIKVDGQKALKETFLSFFTKNPTAEAIRWQQYTPYFNDGDECVFRVGDFTVKIFGITDSTYREGFFDNYKFLHKYAEKNGLKDHVNVGTNLIKFNKLFKDQDDLLRMIFGDHSQITCTREEFIIESYDHE